MLFLLASSLLSTVVGFPTAATRYKSPLTPRDEDGSLLRAQFDFGPFYLTNMTIGCLKEVESDPDFECTMEFTWENPNANNKSDSCRYSWKWDGVTKEHGDQNDYNVDYYRCVRDGAEFFQYYFQGMVDYTSFGMRMSHKFLDTSHFQPPELANMFAEGNFTLRQTENTTTSVIYAAPGPFQAPFRGLTI